MEKHLQTKIIKNKIRNSKKEKIYKIEETIFVATQKNQEEKSSCESSSTKKNSDKTIKLEKEEYQNVRLQYVLLNNNIQ